MHILKIPRKNALVKYLDYQIPVSQLKGTKGNVDMQAARRDGNAPPTHDLNIWLCGRWTDLSVVGVRVGVQTFFLGQSIGIDSANIFILASKL